MEKDLNGVYGDKSMNKEFECWLKEQKYTLTSVGWPYIWDELIIHAKKADTDFKPKGGFKWGLWRQIKV